MMVNVCTDIFIQILMSAQQEHTTAVMTPSVSTPRDLICAGVSLDTRVMGAIVQVKILAFGFAKGLFCLDRGYQWGCGFYG